MINLITYDEKRFNNYQFIIIGLIGIVGCEKINCICSEFVGHGLMLNTICALLNGTFCSS